MHFVCIYSFSSKITETYTYVYIHCEIQKRIQNAYKRKKTHTKRIQNAHKTYTSNWI